MKKLYFIAVFPPIGLLEKIKTIKEEMRKRFNTSHALKIPAHITLQPPIRTNEEEEPQLIATLAACAEKQHPFEIELSGFGSFPPRVLFIQVKSSPELTNLQEEIKKEIKAFDKEKPRHENQGFHPHINIASSDLSKESYFEAWQEFKSKEFEASFITGSFLLLRHNGKSWQSIEEFHFE